MTWTPQERDFERQRLEEELARLMERTAKLAAEFEALRRQRPVRLDEHQAYVAKIHAHLENLQEHHRRVRSAHA